MLRAILLCIAVGLVLGGCATGPTSVKGSECKVFERPQYVILGKTSYDQDWVDRQIEGGVGACKWARPAKRPASLDAAAPTVVSSIPVKRPSFAQRVKARVKKVFHKKPVPVPAPRPVEPTPPVVSPEPPRPEPPKPPPPKRDPVDELLHPDRG